MMFLRVALLSIFFQVQLVTSHWWILLYFVAKVQYMFRVRMEKQQALEVVGMLAAFHLIDYLTRFIPFVQLLFWHVNVAYFLFGIEEKYLSLNTLLLPMGWIHKSIIITYPRPHLASSHWGESKGLPAIPAPSPTSIPCSFCWVAKCLKPWLLVC
jgi:hypothetical protein